MVATIVATRTFRDHRSAAALQRREKQYALLVSQHALEKIAAFFEASRGLLRQGVSRRREMENPKETTAAIKRNVGELTDSWNELYYAFTTVLQVRVDSWSDAELKTRIRTQLLELQDDMVKEVEKLCIGSGKPDFDSQLARHETAILKLIMRAEPGAQSDVF